jgi:hypothetical protein
MTKNYIRLAWSTLALTALLLTGCTADNSLSEIVPEKSETTTTTDDEFINTLKAIPGVVSPELKYGKEYYYFYFQQPIDHYHPEKGTFLQQVAVRLTGHDKDVVVYTHGYNMGTSTCEDLQDITIKLEANQIDIEHRYFGQSMPCSKEDLDFA